MAKKNVQDELVWAIGDDGKEILTPKSTTVEIPYVPQPQNPWGGDGIPVIPAAAQMFSKGSKPTKITAIERRELPQGGHWLFVKYRTTRHVRYVDIDGTPKYGYNGGCYVRNAADALHTWFGSLPSSDGARMLAALKA